MYDCIGWNPFNPGGDMSPIFYYYALPGPSFQKIAQKKVLNFNHLFNNLIRLMSHIDK